MWVVRLLFWLVVFWLAMFLMMAKWWGEAAGKRSAQRIIDQRDEDDGQAL